MTQLDILLLVCDTLDKLKINYMLTGAYAVSFYGRPRSTHDIDINISISTHNVKDIYNAFKDSFYISREQIEEAIRYQSMFNVVHNETIDKIDFWILKDDEFDKERFGRRRKETVSGKEIFISSPEDVILSKLDWYKKSDIQKHYDDVSGIFEIQQRNLDIDYVKKWAEKLSFLSILLEVIKRCNL